MEETNLSHSQARETVERFQRMLDLSGQSAPGVRAELEGPNEEPASPSPARPTDAEVTELVSRVRALFRSIDEFLLLREYGAAFDAAAELERSVQAVGICLPQELTGEIYEKLARVELERYQIGRRRGEAVTDERIRLFLERSRNVSQEP